MTDSEAIREDNKTTPKTQPQPLKEEQTEKKFALGVDFGTNSVRAVIVDLENGNELGSNVFNYKSGRDGIIEDDSDPNLARQNPVDYIEGIESCIKNATAAARSNASKIGLHEFDPADIVGIGIDTTGSTPIPVDEHGTPLSMTRRFKDNPNTMAWLWKDHTAHAEADEITRAAHAHDPDYTQYCGGTYSSEWFFSKILHLARTDPEVYHAAASFVEHCDFMPALLVGDTRPRHLRRSRCSAGHKAMFRAQWGGLPSQEFLSGIDPLFDGIIDKLYTETCTSDAPAGTLCEEWATRLGLREGIAVAVGAFDAHMGAVGTGIIPGTLVKIMGTSSCDMMIAPKDDVSEAIKGICGQVDGSITPGYIGLEAGQSAVGDIYAWFRDLMRWPIENLVPKLETARGHSESDFRAFSEEAKDIIYHVLTEKALKLKPGQSGLVALDWFNGNRTVLVDPNLTGLIVGMTLRTGPEEIFRALIEATAFGARVIMDRVAEYGVDIDKIVACGGLAENNPMIVQIYADITGRKIEISRSGQTCALGAAIFGATAAGHFANVQEAQEKMSGTKHSYSPDWENNKIYNRLFLIYKALHDDFGVEGSSAGMSNIMKDLLDIKRNCGND
jgi:L-ribulokinase